jgi:hypothetical protein
MGRAILKLFDEKRLLQGEFLRWLFEDLGQFYFPAWPGASAEAFVHVKNSAP